MERMSPKACEIRGGPADRNFGHPQTCNTTVHARRWRQTRCATVTEHTILILSNSFCFLPTKDNIHGRSQVPLTKYCTVHSTNSFSLLMLICSVQLAYSTHIQFTCVSWKTEQHHSTKDECWGFRPKLQRNNPCMRGKFLKLSRILRTAPNYSSTKLSTTSAVESQGVIWTGGCHLPVWSKVCCTWSRSNWWPSRFALSRILYIFWNEKDTYVSRLGPCKRGSPVHSSHEACFAQEFSLLCVTSQRRLHRKRRCNVQMMSCARLRAHQIIWAEITAVLSRYGWGETGPLLSDPWRNRQWFDQELPNSWALIYLSCVAVRVCVFAAEKQFSLEGLNIPRSLWFQGVHCGSRYAKVLQSDGLQDVGVEQSRQLCHLMILHSKWKLNEKEVLQFLATSKHTERGKAADSNSNCLRWTQGRMCLFAVNKIRAGTFVPMRSRLSAFGLQWCLQLPCAAEPEMIRNTRSACITYKHICLSLSTWPRNNFHKFLYNLLGFLLSFPEFTSPQGSHPWIWRSLKAKQKDGKLTAICCTAGADVPAVAPGTAGSPGRWNTFAVSFVQGIHVSIVWSRASGVDECFQEMDWLTAILCAYFCTSKDQMLKQCRRFPDVQMFSSPCNRQFRECRSLVSEESGLDMLRCSKPAWCGGTSKWMRSVSCGGIVMSKNPRNFSLIPSANACTVMASRTLRIGLQLWHTLNTTSWDSFFVCEKENLVVLQRFCDSGLFKGGASDVDWSFHQKGNFVRHFWCCSGGWSEGRSDWSWGPCLYGLHQKGHKKEWNKSPQ